MTVKQDERMVAQHPERDLIYAAAGAYLASFDSFLRARTDAAAASRTRTAR